MEFIVFKVYGRGRYEIMDDVFGFVPLIREVVQTNFPYIEYYLPKPLIRHAKTHYGVLEFEFISPIQFLYFVIDKNNKSQNNLHSFFFSKLTIDGVVVTDKLINDLTDRGIMVIKK